MKVSETLGLSTNMYKILNSHSNLYKGGLSQALKGAMAVENIGLKYDRILNGGMVDVIKLSKNMESFQNNYYKFTRPYENLKNEMDSIGKMGKVIESMQNSALSKLNSSTQAWQSSVKLMSNDFLRNYNSIVERATKNLSSGIAAMEYEQLNFNSLKALRIDDFTTALDNIKEVKFDEKLENKIDLQEVEAIVDSKIENIKVTSKEQSNGIVFAINKLTETVIENNNKDNIMSSVVANVLSHIVICLLSLLIGFASSKVPTISNNNYIVKEIKKEVSTMNIDNNFYNNFRMVVKDGLEVRQARKMKSGIKYYLDFGDLVKIEYKNKNWTKISYTNVFTDEREIGWVLTRYIKRLD